MRGEYQVAERPDGLQRPGDPQNPLQFAEVVVQAPGVVARLERLVVIGVLVKGAGHEIPGAVQVRGETHFLDEALEIQRLEDRRRDRPDPDDVEQAKTARRAGQRLQEIDEGTAGLEFEGFTVEPGCRRGEFAMAGRIVQVQCVKRPLVLAAFVNVEIPIVVEVARTDVGQGKAVEVCLLMQYSRGDGKRVGRLDQQVRLYRGNLLRVHVLNDGPWRPGKGRGRRQMVGNGAHAPVENAGSVLVEAGKPGRYPLVEWHVDRAGNQVVQIVGVPAARQLGPHPAFGAFDIGLPGDLPDGTAERTRAIQGTGRPAQHLDALEVENPGIDGFGDRRVVNVEAGRIRALDAPQRHGPVGENPVGCRTERQVGNGNRVVEEFREAALPKFVAGNRGHAQGEGLHGFRALGGGDDDLFEHRLCPDARGRRQQEHGENGPGLPGCRIEMAGHGASLLSYHCSTLSAPGFTHSRPTAETARTRC